MVLNNPDLNNYNANIWDTPGASKPIKHNKMAEFEGAIKALEEENRRLTKLET